MGTETFSPRSCAFCRYWHANPDERNYAHHAWTQDCRRHAPVLVVRQGSSSYTGEGTYVDTEWPSVRGDAWCGDWAAWEGR